MNKLFKGAVAAAAGVALLLGGAGTFALWQDTLPFGVDRTITAGHLEFVTNPMPAARWRINDDLIDEADVNDVRIVPGDTLSMTWDDIAVDVEGGYLVAQFGVDLKDFATGLDPDEQAFYALLNPTIEVSERAGEGTNEDPYVYAEPTGEAVDLAEGVHHFRVVAKVFFSQDATNAVMRQDISLGGLGLTVQQVPHAQHPAYTPPAEEP